MNFPASGFLPSSLPTLTHLLSMYSLQGAGLASVYIKMKKEDLSPLKEFCRGKVKISYTMAYIHLLLTDSCYIEVIGKVFPSYRKSSFSLLNKNLGLILKSSLVREKSEKRTKKKHLDCTYVFGYFFVWSTGPRSQEYQNGKWDDILIFILWWFRVPLALRNSIPN